MNIFIFLCIILWGTSTFLNRLSVERMSPFLMQMVAAVVFVIYVPICLKVTHIGNPLTYKWSAYSVCLTITATIISILANIFLYQSLKGSQTTGSSTMLISLYPVVTLLLSAFFLHEQFTITKIIGVMAMVAGAILLSLK